jgi:hypothetical protein
VTARDEARAPLNPPASDWYERLYRRFREALEAAKRDDCGRCGVAGTGFRHFAYPSECGGGAR